MSNIAPIALFVFNRADHAARTLDALAKNDLAAESELTVFCDGPRGPEDEAKVREVRDLVRQAKGFKQISVVERPENLGLARSVISGVSRLLESNATVVVVEDDLVTSPFFLRFLNNALQRYAEAERVWSVCGYSYPVPGELPESFFLPGAHPWGWATWKRAWMLFEDDQATLLERLTQCDRLYEFDIAGSFPHSAWLARSVTEEVHSWALRWIGSAIVNKGLTLYPGRSLVRNIGMEGSGTNAPETSFYEVSLADSLPSLPPGAPEESLQVLAALRAYHIRWRRTWGWRERLYYLVTALFPHRIERRLYTARLHRMLRLRGLS